jgi:hypothetical protein
MRAEAQAPCVLRVEAYGAKPKYWTGEFMAGWPVYVADRAKAREMTRREAERTAAEFNKRMHNVSWGPEPVEAT